MKNINSAEELHRLFRGASEISKALKGTAIFLEFVGAALAILQIFGILNWFWLPLLLLLFAILSAALRGYGKRSRSFAQQCRKHSFKAFCLGRQVDSITALNAPVDAPFLSIWMVKKLPAQSLEDYYEPISPPGDKRLLELTAHSVFYTWRLLRAHSVISAIGSILMFSLAFTVIYGLASSSDAQTNKLVLEALCSIALVQLCVRGFETATEAQFSFREVRNIEEELLNKPKSQKLNDLVNAYELERAGGYDAPTYLYRFMRDKLQADWHLRRSAIL